MSEGAQANLMLILPLSQQSEGETEQFFPVRSKLREAGPTIGVTHGGGPGAGPAAGSPCHFQNKPGRCSKGKRVNLMTTAISGSRKLLPDPRGKATLHRNQATCLRKGKQSWRCTSFTSARVSIMLLTLPWRQEVVGM